MGEGLGDVVRGARPRDRRHRRGRPHPSGHGRRGRRAGRGGVRGLELPRGRRRPPRPGGLGAPGRVRDQPAQDEGRRVQRDAVLGTRARAVRGPRGDPRRAQADARRRPGRDRQPAAMPGPHSSTPSGSSPTPCSTSPSRPTVPTRGAWPASPVTWPRRLHLPFSMPDPPTPATDAERLRWRASRASRWSTTTCARASRPASCSTSSVGPSPQWMARRLTLAGMRPINNVVDASNYVMLELGQPTHPYDLDLVGGHGLRVRAARPGEIVTTLDGVERRMGERSVGHRGRPARLCHLRRPRRRPSASAGSWAGRRARSRPRRRRVLLEAAYFTPMAIARTSKRLNLRSEASARFERGCDPEGIDRAALRLCRAPRGHGGGALPQRRRRRSTSGVRCPVPAQVAVRTARVNAVLGSDLDDDQVVGYLEPIGFGCDGAVGGRDRR